jgi:hypothetical protein
MPQTTSSKIGSWLLATAIIGAGAVYVYYVYSPVIEAWIGDIQRGNLSGSLANDPVLGNKNPLDALVQKYNPFQSKAGFSYGLAAEEERPEPWALLTR